MGFIKSDEDEFGAYGTDPFYQAYDEKWSQRKSRDFTLPQERAEEEDDRYEFVKGIKAGIDQTAALGGGLKAAVGSAVGNRQWVDDGLDYYQEQMRLASRYSPRTAFEEDWGEDGWVDGVTDFTDWLSFTAGNLVPSVVGMLGTGGLGGVIAGGTAKAATTLLVKSSVKAKMKDVAEGMAKKQILKESQQRYVGLVAKKYSKIASKVGSGVGGFAFSGGAGTGENFGRIYEETGLEDPGLAISLGIAMGALDLVGVPFRAFRKMFPDEPLDKIKDDLAQAALNERGTIKKMFDRVITPETRTGSIGAEALKSGLLEGVTEVAQEFLSRTSVKWASENLSEEEQERFEGYLYNEDAVSSYIHSFAAGMVGGNFMGGVTGGIAGPSSQGKANRELREKNKTGEKEPTLPPFVEQEKNREKIQADQREKASQAYEEDQGSDDLPPNLVGLREKTLENMEFEVAPTVGVLAEANGVSLQDQQEILDIMEGNGEVVTEIDENGVTYKLGTVNPKPQTTVEPVNPAPQTTVEPEVNTPDKFAGLEGMELESARFNDGDKSEGIDVAATVTVAPEGTELTSTIPVVGNLESTDVPINQQVTDTNNQQGESQQPNGDDTITQRGMTSFSELVQKITGSRVENAPKDTVGGKQSDDDLLPIDKSFGATDVENSPEVKTFASLLVEAVRRGLPREALDSVSGFFGFDGGPADGNATYVPAAYSNSTNTILVNKGDISEATTSDDAKKNLLFYVTHELYHALDAAKGFSEDMLGMRVKLSKVDGDIKMDLDTLSAEMYQAYADGNELGDVFKYPFDTIANYLANRVDGNLESGAKMIRKELFAQAGAMFTNNPKLLKKFAPKTYRMMQGIQADSTSLTERTNASNAQSQDATTEKRPPLQPKVRTPSVDRGDEAPDTGEPGRDSEEGGGGQPADTGVEGQSDNQDGDGDGRTVSVKEQFDSKKDLDEIPPTDNRVAGPNTSRADQGRADDETEAGVEDQSRELDKEIAETKGDTQSQIKGLEPVELLVDELSLSQDVPQFKSGANNEGVVERLGGKFDKTGVGPIIVWERNDGRKEIISGRHRWDLAKRSGEKTILSQVFREADGFTVEQAAILDAELNLRDGQGQVKDYVNYFKADKITKEEAVSRGLLDRATGKRAYAIATDGSEELITAHRNDQITDTEAEAVALNAPGNTALQAAGLKALINGSKAIEAVNVMKAVMSVDPNAGGGGQQDSMFAFDDSAMQTATAMSKIVSKKQREITADLSAITGASKKPEVAKKYGVNVKNAAALKAVIDGLKADRLAWENWHTNPELVAEINSEMKGDPDLLSMVTRPSRDRTRDPDLQRAVQDRVDRKITAQDLNETFENKGRPVLDMTPDQVPDLVSDKKAVAALTVDKRELWNQPLEEGVRYGSRLDIPASDRPSAGADPADVVTVHTKKATAQSPKANKKISHMKTIRMTNVEFAVPEKGAKKIALGAQKNTIATIEGDYVKKTDEENHAEFKSLINDPAWTQVSMNPIRHSFFYRLSDQYPVLSADEVIQVGNLVLAKNVNKNINPEPDDFSYIEVQGRGKSAGLPFNLNDQVLAERQTSSMLTKYFPRKWVAAIQDKLERWETVENAIADTLGIGRLPSEISFRDTQNQMDSRLQKQLEDFGEGYVVPLADLAKEYGFSADQIGAYLLAKHARERNARMLQKEMERRAKVVASIEKQLEETDSDVTRATMQEKLDIIENTPFDFEVNGSGVTNADADALLKATEDAGTKDQFESIATGVYKMLDDMRANMVAKGLLDEDSKNEWEDTYDFYVPLKGFLDKDDSVVPGGSRTKGFSITGPESMKARGRLTLPQNPLLMAIKEASEKIIRAEKNVTSQRLLSLVEKFSSTDKDVGWTVYNNKFRPPVDDATKAALGEMKTIEDMRRERMKGYDLPKYVEVKRGGATFLIEFRDPILNAQIQDANSMTLSTGNDVADAMFKFGRRINNFRRKMIINYNPSWGLINPIRDVETGLAYLMSEQQKVNGRVKGLDLVGSVFTGWKGSFQAYRRHELGKESNSPEQSEIFKFIDDYIDDGAPTGLATMKDIDELRADFEKEMGPQPLKVGNVNLPSAIAARTTFRKWADAAIEQIEAFNQASENAIRLSTYIEARKAGVPRKDAASLAKDLTVNFNRKGEYSSQIDAMYLFFNAAIQGNVNLKDALVGSSTKGEKATLFGVAATKKLFFGMITFGITRTIANIMMSGEDDDGESIYADYSPYLLQTSAALTGPTWGAGVPIPYGWGWADNVGRLIGEQIMGVKEPGVAAAELMGVTLHHFSPRGLHAVNNDNDTIANVIHGSMGLLPDVGLFAYEQGANLNFFGSPIVLPSPYTDAPHSHNSKRGTLEVFKEFAKTMNSVTGGTEHVSGGIDMAPDRMQHIFDFVLGGVGRFGTDTVDTIQKSLVPEAELKNSDLPIARKFFFNPSEYKDQFRYYDNRTELSQEMAGWKAADTGEKMRLVQRRSRIYYTRIDDLRKATDKKLRTNRGLMRTLQNSTGGDRDRVGARLRRLEDANELLYDNFNKAYKQSK